VWRAALLFGRVIFEDEFVLVVAGERTHVARGASGDSSP
jgi:hypothetical protein